MTEPTIPIPEDESHPAVEAVGPPHRFSEEAWVEPDDMMMPPPPHPRPDENWGPHHGGPHHHHHHGSPHGPPHVPECVRLIHLGARNCGGDVCNHCAGTIDPISIMKCLHDSQALLSDRCTETLAEWDAIACQEKFVANACWNQMNASVTACSADADKFCPAAKGDGEAWHSCLAGHMSKLSDGCKASATAAHDCIKSHFKPPGENIIEAGQFIDASFAFAGAARDPEHGPPPPPEFMGPPDFDGPPEYMYDGPDEDWPGPDDRSREEEDWHHEHGHHEHRHGPEDWHHHSHSDSEDGPHHGRGRGRGRDGPGGREHERWGREDHHGRAKAIAGAIGFVIGISMLTTLLTLGLFYCSKHYCHCCRRRILYARPGQFQSYSPVPPPPQESRPELV